MEVTRRVMGATVYEQYSFRADSGRSYVRQRATLPDGATSLYQRPIYPDHPPVRHVASVDEEKATAKVEIPPVKLPARELGPLDSLPKAQHDLAELARQHGWTARFFYAIGPRIDHNGKLLDPELRTLTLRCCRGAERVVFCWEWKAAWRSTRRVARKGPDKQPVLDADGEKVYDEVIVDNPDGWYAPTPTWVAAYDAPFSPCTHTAAKKALQKERS